MQEQIIIAGFGGQGVLSLGKTLCFAGMKKDWNVSWLPSYGPEVRGGTANCQVIISKDEIASPMFESASALLAFNEPSLIKFKTWLEKGAVAIVNASLVTHRIEREDIEAYYVPANELAEEAGSAKCLNVVMLGAYTAATQRIDRGTMLAVLRDMFMQKSERIYQMNQKAFELGEAWIRRQQSVEK